MIILTLFLTFMQIGLSAFGGGYAALPLIQNNIVERQAWISLTQLADITSISQMTPGPILVNAATFVGIKIAGLGGGLMATLGAVIPSFILVLILGSLLFKHGNLRFVQNILKALRPIIVGLIFAAVLSLSTLSLLGVSGTSQIAAITSFTIALILSLKTKLDTLVLVFIGALVGFLSLWI